MKHLGRVRWLWMCLILLPSLSWGQVIPPFGSGTGVSIVGGVCPGQVVTGLTILGVPTCTTVTSGHVDPSIAQTGVDINPAHQVTATHLSVPLPFLQGGHGLGSGAPGGLLYFPTTTSLGSSLTLPLNQPVLGGGSGNPPTTGTLSGDTTVLGTVQGALTPNRQLTFDASGNISTTAFVPGTSTQAGLTWLVVTGTCTTDAGGGKLTVTADNAIVCAPDNGGGSVAITGTPLTGQLTRWSSATSVEGVSLLPAATFPALVGDVTTSAGSLATVIAPGAVTLAQMASMATSSLLGRVMAGAGPPESLSVATVKSLLGLTGTNSGDQTITLTGDVTGSGTGSFATTLATVNSNVGSFTAADITVDAQGRITAAASGSGGAGDVTAVGSCLTGACFTVGTPGESLTFRNATSGSVTLQTVPGALGTRNLSLPAETGTVCTTGSVCSGYQASLGFSAVPDSRTVTIAGTANQLTSSAGAQDLTANRTWTLSIPSNAQLSLAKLTNLTGNGFVKTASGDGSLSVDTATYLTGNQTVTLAGDVTGSGATAITTVLANIPPATPMVGSLVATAIVAPSTPAAGKGAIYFDSTSKNLAVKDDAGVVKHGVQTDTGAANTFLTGISAAGVISKAQPAFSNLVGVCTVAQGCTGTASTLNGLVRGHAAAMTAAELSGDAFTSGNNVVTLAAVNANPGTFTRPEITVDTKGRITLISNGADPACLTKISNANGITGADIVIGTTPIVVITPDVTTCSALVLNTSPTHALRCRGPENGTVTAVAGSYLPPGAAMSFGAEARSGWTCIRDQTAPAGGTVAVSVTEIKP